MKTRYEMITSVLEKAVNHYGKKAQKDQCIEECLELSLAMRKHLRYPDDKDKVTHVIDEIADCIIMLGQMSLIFGVDKVEERIDYKVDRLDKRIEGDNGN
jgi:NTP pyrophosphatase (non-canonical NTP hydrolase)